MSGIRERHYFFDAGLRFECRRCGQCCCGAPGLVWVDAAEARAIAAFTAAGSGETAADYLIPQGRGFAIRERSDGRCWFFDQGCRIYPLRPLQCRIYPFWLENLRSERRWQEAARQCPGIGEGRCYTREEILAFVATDRRLCRLADVSD